MLSRRRIRGKYLVAEKDSQEAKTQIRICNERDLGYRTIASNYFIVGWTGTGEMSIDFAIQNAALPEYTDHELLDVDGNKRIGKDLKNPIETPRIVRRFQIGVLLSPEGAMVLSKLLVDTVENYKKTLKK